MTMKTKIVIAIAAAAGVYLYYRHKNATTRPTCSAGSTWKVESDPTGYSATVAESIRKFGGYCAKQGFVSDPYEAGDGPITEPWQVP